LNFIAVILFVAETIVAEWHWTLTAALGCAKDLEFS